MTEKDIDLLTRFTNHIESALELIKMIKDTVLELFVGDKQWMI